MNTIESPPISCLTVKIIIDGPPACGKTHFQRRIMEFVESIKDEYPGMAAASHDRQMGSRIITGDLNRGMDLLNDPPKLDIADSLTAVIDSRIEHYMGNRDREYRSSE